MFDIDIIIKVEMGDKEGAITSISQINLQHLKILVRSLNFTNEYVMAPVIKSRLLKMVLKKLGLDFDT